MEKTRATYSQSQNNSHSTGLQCKSAPHAIRGRPRYTRLNWLHPSPPHQRPKTHDPQHRARAKQRHTETPTQLRYGAKLRLIPVTHNRVLCKVAWRSFVRTCFGCAMQHARQVTNEKHQGRKRLGVFHWCFHSGLLHKGGYVVLSLRSAGIGVTVNMALAQAQRRTLRPVCAGAGPRCSIGEHYDCDHSPRTTHADTRRPARRRTPTRAPRTSNAFRFTNTRTQSPYVWTYYRDPPNAHFFDFNIIS